MNKSIFALSLLAVAVVGLGLYQLQDKPVTVYKADVSLCDTSAKGGQAWRVTELTFEEQPKHGKKAKANISYEMYRDTEFNYSESKV